MKNFCTQCPLKCNIDRNLYKGRCGVTNTLKIAKYYLHPFEEPLISKNNRSGTIFFSGCSLKCTFCQNYEISHNTFGKEISTPELIDIFKRLEDDGADNISLVTPTHYISQIVNAFEKYKPKVPIVYNTHGYENLENLKIIDPYIDIYLPDLKFISNDLSKRYTKLDNYFTVAEPVLKFMMNSKKTVILDGQMTSGVIIRHLILPLCVNDSISVVKWFKENSTNNAYLSLMSQYTPIKQFETTIELNRPITSKEYQKVLNQVYLLNLENVIIQEKSSVGKNFIPKWDLN